MGVGEKGEREGGEEVQGKQKSEGTLQRKCGAKFVFTIGPEKVFVVRRPTAFSCLGRLLTPVPSALPIA